MVQPRSDSLTRLLTSPGFELVAPLFLFLYLHYAFFSWYAGTYLTWESFVSTFAEGVYKYRMLGPHVVVALHDALPTGIRHLFAQPEYMARLLPQHDLSVYNTMNLINFVAFAATLVIARSLLRSVLPGNYQSLYWMLIGWVLASAAVVTPYDFLAYFFLVATIAAFEWRRSAIAYPALLMLTVLGSLTRETQALAIPYAVSTLIAASPGRARMIVPRVLVVAAAFGTTYVMLRANLGWEHGVFQSIQLYINQSALGAFGLVVATAMLILVHLTAVRSAPYLPDLRRRLLVLYALALPYWATVIFAGIYFELRLFIPLAMVHAAAIVNRRGTRTSDDEKAHTTSAVTTAG